jgi:hypothetical protein
MNELNKNNSEMYVPFDMSSVFHAKAYDICKPRVRE